MRRGEGIIPGEARRQANLLEFFWVGLTKMEEYEFSWLVLNDEVTRTALKRFDRYSYKVKGESRTSGGTHEPQAPLQARW